MTEKPKIKLRLKSRPNYSQNSSETASTNSSIVPVLDLYLIDHPIARSEELECLNQKYLRYQLHNQLYQIQIPNLCSALIYNFPDLEPDRLKLESLLHDVKFVRYDYDEEMLNNGLVYHKHYSLSYLNQFKILHEKLYLQTYPNPQVYAESTDLMISHETLLVLIEIYKLQYTSVDHLLILLEHATIGHYTGSSIYEGGLNYPGTFQCHQTWFSDSWPIFPVNQNIVQA